MRPNTALEPGEASVIGQYGLAVRLFAAKIHFFIEENVGLPYFLIIFVAKKYLIITNP